MPCSRDEIIARLKAHRAELEAHEVLHASLFGSAARGEAGAGSDIDIAVKFRQGPRLRGFAYARIREDLRRRLSEILEAEVDLSDEDMMRERVRESFKEEAVRAF